ncbi:MAG: hypothetical protein ACE5JV_03165 [Nitrososphaerales archaeon]
MPQPQQDQEEETCDHSNVYFGAVNIRYQERTIGAVDVWRCTKCKKMFCEEKQLGILDITSEIGMPRIGPDERWAVLVCGLKQSQERWALVRVKRDGTLLHPCVDKETSLNISDFKVQGDERHRIFMIDQSTINREVEID